MYDKLRRACLNEGFQEEYPGWPFSLLFHSHEITRDIFFLDPLIEYGEIDLGRNPVRDASFLRYRYLNQWFHYQFFNGLAPVTNSAETVTLLPRMHRLHRALLESHQSQSLASYLEREFAVSDVSNLHNSITAAVANVIRICGENDLVVWGVCLDDGAFEQHMRYVREVSLIRTDLVMELPHLRPLKREWEYALKVEEKSFRKAEAGYNKRMKYEKRFQSPKE